MAAMKENEIIARIKILRGEIALQECRVDGFVDSLSELRLKDKENPTDQEIEESRKWQ